MTISSVLAHISKLIFHGEKQGKRLHDIEVAVDDNAELFPEENGDDITGNNCSNEALGRQPHVAVKKK